METQLNSWTLWTNEWMVVCICLDENEWLRLEEWKWMWNCKPDKIEWGKENFGIWHLPLFNHLKPEGMKNNDFKAFKVE